MFDNTQLIFCEIGMTMMVLAYLYRQKESGGNGQFEYIMFFLGFLVILIGTTENAMPEGLVGNFVFFLRFVSIVFFAFCAMVGVFGCIISLLLKLFESSTGKRVELKPKTSTTSKSGNTDVKMKQNGESCETSRKIVD